MSVEELDAWFGEGKWFPIVRFGLWQKGKYRMVDDPSDFQNLTFGSDEQIHTTSASAAATLSKGFREQLGRKLTNKFQLLGSSRDMTNAYKQIAIHESQTRFVVIVVWHPALNRWVFVIVRALAFGLTGAVLHFNRVPAFIVALCRRWFAIAIQNFYDDFRIIELAFARGSGFKMFAQVCELLGWKFDPAKDQAPTNQLPMLGNIEDWSRMHTDAFLVRAKT